MDLLNGDPYAHRLLTSSIPARLAHVGLDGGPRAIPIAYHFDGARFVLATIDFSPKVKAIQANPAVALTIDITPTWAKVLDFETRAPTSVMELASAKGMAG